MNKIKELIITIKFKEKITFKNIPESLSYALNFYFSKEQELRDFHKSKSVKLYSYSHIIPKKDTYEKEDIGWFKIRFFDTELFSKFENELYKVENPVFSIIQIKPCGYIQTTEIKTMITDTPAVITKQGLYWTPRENELDFVKDRIIKNTIKKYNAINKTSEDYYDFIEKVELVSKNLKPYSFRYKKGRILANKFIIHIKSDEKSQELAKVIIAAGLLEKNSLSYGFVSLL